MQIVRTCVGIFVVLGVTAMTLERPGIIKMNPRVPDDITDSSHPLVQRNGCHHDQQRCGPGCCSSKGLCAIIGPGKYECIICEDPNLFVCGGTNCCS